MRKLCMVVPLVLCMLFSLVSVVSARTLSVNRQGIPLTSTVCNGGLGNGNDCRSQLGWQGISTHGAGTIAIANNPSTMVFREYIELDNGSFVDAGIEVNDNTTCGGTTLQWWYSDYNTIKCPGAVDSRDFNNAITLKISYYASNGGGFLYWMWGGFDTPCDPCSLSDSNGPTKFTQSYEIVFYDIASFSGHKVWGSDFSSNQFFNNGLWAYDGTSGTILRTNNSCNTGSCTPPQMYWKSAPNGSKNNGGDLYFCLYDSTNNSCTFGS